jgi:hypothetical protein
MKNRARSYYRHQRKRVINRKLKMLKYAWGLDQRDDRDHSHLKQPGRLSKAKLNCSCEMCKFEKHFEILKPQVKSKKDLMQWDIKEYFNK